MLDTPRSAIVGHRRESWRFEMTDLDGHALGTLDGVESATFNYSIFDTIRSGGSLTYRGSNAPQWHRVMIQPVYELLDESGVTHEWPFGVFIAATPKTDYSDTGPTIDVQLYDKLLILDEDKTATTYTVDKGTNAADAVRAVIASGAPTSRIVVTDSDATTATPRVWEAGSSKLQIANDLLDGMNYFSLVADRNGTFRGDPYVPPGARGIAWDFRDNEESIYAPDFSHEADTFSVENRVVLIGESEGDEPALVATATNTDPGSPWSYANRGRWITLVDEGVEATDANTLGAIAARRLLERAQVTSSFTISAALMPLDLNETITLMSERAGVDVRCVIQQMDVSTDVGALMGLNIRQIV